MATYVTWVDAFFERIKKAIIRWLSASSVSKWRRKFSFHILRKVGGATFVARITKITAKLIIN